MTNFDDEKSCHPERRRASLARRSRRTCGCSCFCHCFSGCHPQRGSAFAFAFACSPLDPPQKIVISTEARSAEWRNPLFYPHHLPAQTSRCFCRCISGCHPRRGSAFASRYPKASALGLSVRSSNEGFSPWGMLSCPRHQTLESLDTHDKINSATKQSGASRTAPFNASL